jgi:hypothetical protein
MYLIKRNSIYHLVYYDERGKQQSKSTKCSKKSEANKFAASYLQGLKKNKQKVTLLTYKEFQDFYSDYASNRFSKSYQEFIGYAFKQLGRIINPYTLLKEVTERDIDHLAPLYLINISFCTFILYPCFRTAR